MLVLQEGEVCPFQTRCPYNKDYIIENGKCYGAKENRDTVFTCEFVDYDAWKEIVKP